MDELAIVIHELSDKIGELESEVRGMRSDLRWTRLAYLAAILPAYILPFLVK